MTQKATSDGSENLVEIRGLTRAFAGSEGVINVLDGIDFLIPYNSLTVIRGPSGAGKSTLLRILGLLDAGFTGSMRLAGKDVASLTTSERDATRTAVIGLVFQEGRLLPHLSLAENIALPLQFAGLTSEEAVSQAEQAEAFDAMIKWERDGVKPGGDDVVTPAIVAATSYGCTYTKNTLGPDESGTTRALRPATVANSAPCPTP